MELLPSAVAAAANPAAAQTAGVQGPFLAAVDRFLSPAETSDAGTEASAASSASSTAFTATGLGVDFADLRAFRSRLQ